MADKENKAIKEYTFTVGERLYLLPFITAYKGSLEKLAFVQEDSKKFYFDKEEREKLDLRAEGNNTRWNPEKAEDISISLHEVTRDFILEEFEKRDKEGQFALNELELVTGIKNKLE